MVTSSFFLLTLGSLFCSYKYRIVKAIQREFGWKHNRVKGIKTVFFCKNAKYAEVIDFQYLQEKSVLQNAQKKTNTHEITKKIDKRRSGKSEGNQ